MAGKPPEVKILGDASGAQKAAKDAADALDDLGDKADKAGSDLDGLARDADQAEDKVSRFGKSADDTKGKINDFGDDLKSRLGPAGEVAGGAIDKVTGVLGQMPPAALAATGGVAALGAGLVALGASSVMKLSDTVADMEMLRSKSGATLEEVSRLAYAMERAGVNTDDLDEVMEEWGTGLDENTPKLQAMGVEIAKNADGTTNSDQTFRNFLSTLRSVEDPAKRMALANQIIGESAYRIEPAVRLSEQAFNDFYDAADEAGAVISDLDAESVRALNNATADLEASWSSIQLQLARGLTPAVADFLQTAADLGSQLAELEGKTHVLGNALAVMAAPMKLLDQGLEAIGVGGDDAAEAMAGMAESASDVQAESDSARGALEPLTGATLAQEQASKDADQAADDLRQSFKDQEQAIKDAEAAFRSQIDTVRAATDASYAVRDAEDAVFDASQALEEKTRTLAQATNEHGAESLEAAGAQREVDGAARDLERRYLDLASRTAEATIKQMEMGGEMLTMPQKRDIMVGALDQVRSTLEPGSALYNAVSQYRENLANIPTQIDTRLNVYANLAANNTGINFNLAALAEGGPAEKGRPYIVGEGGEPELFVPDQDGMVIPRSKIGRTGGGGGSNGWGGGPVEAHLYIDSREVTRVQVRTLRGMRR